MKTMSIILTILILVIGALYIGETEITINPFSIKIVAYRKLIGFILLGIGLGLIQADAGRKAVNDFKVELLEDLKTAKHEIIKEEVETLKPEENDNQ
jgi:hypothetical protein